MHHVTERPHRLHLSVLAAVAGLAVAACGDSTGPEGTGEASVLLTQASGATANVQASLISLEETAGDVPLDAVGAIQITLSRVEALRTAAGAGEGGEGNGEGEGNAGQVGWFALTLEEETAIDILTLPTVGGLEVARGEVPAGDYTNVRLFFASATLTLSEQVTLGDGTVLEPGDYDVFIPSADQTGLKIPSASFNVAEGESETVVIEIDTEASAQTLVWNANGFLLSPVLTADDGGEGS